MSRYIYTIGYSAFKVKDFISQLKKYNINCLIDVRSVPVASEFYYDYNKDIIKNILKQNKIYYRNYSEEFGARQKDLKFYTNGQMDFRKFVKSEQFLSGVNKIKKGMELGYNFALMCSEKDPINCHRSILVAKGMRDLGFKPLHILANGSIQTQEDIDRRLLEMYFPDYLQCNLFESFNESVKIEEVYLLQNKKIGYKLSENNELKVAV